MKKIIKSTFVIFVILFIIVFSFVDDEENTITTSSTKNDTTQSSSYDNDTVKYSKDVSTSYPVNTENDIEWVMYWYLCGSDLESDYGAATDDFEELMSISLPENVQFVIQTGGARNWQNDYVDQSKTQRFLYDYTGLTLLEELPKANMGEEDTLSDFLQFASSNYPANKVMINLWNHGGGSLTGIAFDENYHSDALTLPELYSAFTTVYTETPSNPPVDIIAFDACLMATLDTAYIFSDIAKYMVASEDLEPGIGWDYTALARELANDQSITPLELGISICDSYYDACKKERMEKDITLSVVDLSKIGNVIDAYDYFGASGLEYAVEERNFFNELSKAAKHTENYGGNNRRDGYTNMLDLGDFALQMSDLLPEPSSDLFEAVNDCVVYSVNGPLRSSSYGLATYYYYDNDMDYFNDYTIFAPSVAVKYLYEYGLTGDLSRDGFSYLDNFTEIEMEEDSYAEVSNIFNSYIDFEDFPIYFDDEACAVLDLGPEAYDYLAAVGFELYYMDYEEDIMLFLGTDNDIIADWDNCIFKDNFRGVWGSIDGNLCYMELAYEGDDYNSYCVPVLLNGEEYNLDVIYDFNIEEYYIYGARKAISENGYADKHLRLLKNGDVIETIHYANILSSDDDDLFEVPVDKIIVDDNTSFYDEELGDGVFVLMFTMLDSMGNVATSEVFSFEIEDGEIYMVE